MKKLILSVALMISLFQPAYFDLNGDMESVSKVIFSTYDEALRYGKFVCQPGFHVDIINLEMFEKD